MIFILTGPIRSGKTTALRQWVENRTDTDGLLSPDDESGTRYFYEIKSDRKFLFEAERDSSEPIIEIGRFQFLKSAFDRANLILINAARDEKNIFIVADELGKLELKDQGLSESLLAIIPQFMVATHRHLVLVIRDGLLEAAIEHFGLTECQILNKNQLEEVLS